MAGGSHSQRGPGAPLWSRAGPDASAAQGLTGNVVAGGDPGPDASAAQGLTATPCWIDAAGTIPGDVLAWRRDGTGGWQALVGAWLPAAAVRPRDAAPP